MRLPAFSNLIAFDAVARHGTLTRAAAELNVSQPAISRRIAMLETDLSCALFDRATKPLSLTESGLELFDVLRSGLSRLELVIDRLRSKADTKAISISAGSGFAAYWLIPRLPEIQAAFPDLDIRIISQSHSEDTSAGDLQIRFGDGSWAETKMARIFGEEVFPVCSPLYLDGRSLPFTLEELKTLRLLGMPDNRQPWYEWNSCFEALGSPVHQKLRTLDFDSYAHLVSTALAGQGVCLCWAGLLDAFLSSGALVRLTEISASSTRGYYVTHRLELAPSSPVRKVAEWIAHSSAAL